MDREFYDRCYESWCQGKSADLDYDRWDYYRSQGYYPDEISVNMMHPRPPEPEPEYEKYAPEQTEVEMYQDMEDGEQF